MKYNELAIQLHGEFAKLNIIDPVELKVIEELEKLSTTHKQCNKCKEYKLFDEFSRDKNIKSGIVARCKLCIKQTAISKKL